MKLRVLSCIFLFLLLFARLASAQIISVSGYVTDTKGKPISKAKVIVIPVSPKVNPVATTTDDDGYYRVGVPRGAELDVVYGSRGRQVAVRRLIGHRDQFISKVLAPAQGSSQHVFDYLQSIEYVGFYSQTNKRLVSTMAQNEILPTNRFIANVVAEMPGKDRQTELVRNKFEWMKKNGLLEFLK